MAFPQSVRVKAYRRAGGQCECTRPDCGHWGRCPAALVDDWHAHHRQPQAADGPDTLDNCEALCVPCHRNTHGETMHRLAALFTQNPPTQREPYDPLLELAALFAQNPPTQREPYDPLLELAALFAQNPPTQREPYDPLLEALAQNLSLSPVTPIPEPQVHHGPPWRYR